MGGRERRAGGVVNPRPTAGDHISRQGSREAGSVIRHHFTVDVEEYFQVLALAPHVPRDAWDDIPSRVEASVDRILALLDEHDARGTFFTLGWIGERHPELVRRIAAAGHEVASHGQAHRRVTELEPASFRESVRRSKAVLEELTGEPVLGYRAPSYSITPDVGWALEILVEEGYRYDSSLFPIRRAGYGWPGGGRGPYTLDLEAGPLEQFPPATARLGGAVLPAAGGAYFRLLPYGLVRAGLREAERAGCPGTFYIHPWELDPDQPRLDVPLRTRVRHYGRLAGVEARLKRLLREFRFQSIAATLDVRTGPAGRQRSPHIRC
jgi:polysaccharide deacetylase family protein (PEP-CTERM system associated)